ncbi:MAG: hypothetical protein M1825_005610 [Sarcosagium campestre]|nr:MAG: hypothetical protein M1825_005610 [Sarcosagium campestre]
MEYYPENLEQVVSASSADDSHSVASQPLGARTFISLPQDPDPEYADLHCIRRWLYELLRCLNVPVAQAHEISNALDMPAPYFYQLSQRK